MPRKKRSLKIPRWAKKLWMQSWRSGGWAPRLSSSSSPATHSKRLARPACANYFGAAGAEAALVAGGGGVGASGVSPGRFVKTEVAWLAGATAGALLGA